MNFVTRNTMAALPAYLHVVAGESLNITHSFPLYLELTANSGRLSHPHHTIGYSNSLQLAPKIPKLEDCVTYLSSRMRLNPGCVCGIYVYITIPGP